MKKNILVILCFVLSVSSYANKVANTDSIKTFSSQELVVDKSVADSAYIKENYESAISIYEQLLEEGDSPVLYYNLGNSYYKNGQLGKAILNYERALLLDPSNSDIEANLAIARSKTIDKLETIPELFIITWIKSVANIAGMDTWAKLAVLFISIFILSVAFFSFTKTLKVKKISFISGVISLCVLIISLSAAQFHEEKMSNKNEAIVVNPSVVVRSTPSESGTKLFVLHEGTKVTVKDNTMDSWKEIRLSDGKVGWLPQKTIELI